jgi:hypothetical protein
LSSGQLGIRMNSHGFTVGALSGYVWLEGASHYSVGPVSPSPAQSRPAATTSSSSVITLSPSTPLLYCCNVFPATTVKPRALPPPSPSW